MLTHDENHRENFRRHYLLLTYLPYTVHRQFGRKGSGIWLQVLPARNICISIILYADDVLLLARSLGFLTPANIGCVWKRTSSARHDDKCKKSLCLRIGPRLKVKCWLLEIWPSHMLSCRIRPFYGMNVVKEIHLNAWKNTPRAQGHSRPGHWNRHRSIRHLWLPINVHSYHGPISKINGNFSLKSPNFPIPIAFCAPAERVPVRIGYQRSGSRN